MADTRLIVIETCVFEHPSAPVGLDERYCEVHENTRLAWTWGPRTISGPMEIQPDMEGPPRRVTVINMAGADIERYLTDEQTAALNRQTLHVGPPEKPDLCLLEPRRVSMTVRGQAQSFWLAPGARLVVAPAVAGESVPVRIVAFPGG